MTEPQVRAAGILSQRFSQPIRLNIDAKLPSSNRTHVYRCCVLDGPDEAPKSVIVKQATLPYGTTFKGAVDGNVWNDWAGLQFVNEVFSEVTLVPAVYGGDAGTGLIVIEDLGSGRSLRDVLASTDPMFAEESIVRYFATLGKLHARTRDYQAVFQDIRASLGLYSPEREYHYQQSLQTPRMFYEIVQQLQITPRPGADDDLATLLATLMSPGPFLVYVHGDPTPANFLLVETTSRLIDFEYGVYGHACVEGAQARMLFPSSGYSNRIPPHIIQSAEAAYREELAQGCPEAADHTLFARAIVVGCAYWTINFCSWLPFSDLLMQDRTYGIATIRQRVILRAETFADMAEEAGYLEALGATFRSVASKLRTIWPEAVDSMPLYPAFRS